jgi:hypothetical protein
MADPDLAALTALRRLRHVETDTARRALGEAMTQETALAAREAAMRRDLDAARRMTGDFDREAFMAWFSRTRATWTVLGGELREAASRTEAARAALGRRRLAETAAEEALAQAAAVKQAALDRREQAMLEEVARELKRSGR